jgi:NadR type nicotinamide-nucleotide adenylyltransferase
MANGEQQKPMPLKIAITGPESTGKSMLAKQLAEHYNTVWVPEYAREYINKLDRPYNQEDILEIAKGQIRSETAICRQATDLLICDTELIVTKIWSEVKYGNCDPWILNKIESHKYHLYLLCDIDIPWSEDPQREHPHLREHLRNLYRKELLASELPFFIVSGIGHQRLDNAIRIIDSFTNSKGKAEPPIF